MPEGCPNIDPDVGRHLAEGLLQPVSLPRQLSSIVQPSIPYQSVIRWKEIERAVTILNGFDADLEQFLEAHPIEITPN